MVDDKHVILIQLQKIVRLVLELGIRSGPYPRRGGGIPTPSAKNLIFFNFLWSYGPKFSIFCAWRCISAPPANVFNKMLLFSSKKLRIFVKNTQPFCYYLFGHVFYFFKIFAPSAFYFDKKFRACPPSEISGYGPEYAVYDKYGSANIRFVDDSESCKWKKPHAFAEFWLFLLWLLDVLDINTGSLLFSEVRFFIYSFKVLIMHWSVDYCC